MVDRKIVAAGLVAALLLFAGCSGTGGSETGTGTEVTTTADEGAVTEMEQTEESVLGNETTENATTENETTANSSMMNETEENSSMEETDIPEENETINVENETDTEASA